MLLVIDGISLRKGRANSTTISYQDDELHEGEKETLDLATHFSPETAGVGTFLTRREHPRKYVDIRFDEQNKPNTVPSQSQTAQMRNLWPRDHTH
jgi:hypothetical protein